jgi:hypothetical protein
MQPTHMFQMNKTFTFKDNFKGLTFTNACGSNNKHNLSYIECL